MLCFRVLTVIAWFGLFVQTLDTTGSTAVPGNQNCEELIDNLAASDSIIINLMEEIPVPYGGNASVCAGAISNCSCALVIVDGSNHECHSYPYNGLLLALYNIYNVTMDHTVTFALMCNGINENSNEVKILVKVEVFTSMPSPSSTVQDLVSFSSSSSFANEDLVKFSSSISFANEVIPGLTPTPSTNVVPDLTPTPSTKVVPGQTSTPSDNGWIYGVIFGSVCLFLAVVICIFTAYAYCKYCKHKKEYKSPQTVRYGEVIEPSTKSGSASDAGIQIELPLDNYPLVKPSEERSELNVLPVISPIQPFGGGAVGDGESESGNPTATATDEKEDRSVVLAGDQVKPFSVVTDLQNKCIKPIKNDVQETSSTCSAENTDQAPNPSSNQPEDPTVTKE